MFSQRCVFLWEHTQRPDSSPASHGKGANTDELLS